MGRKKQDKKSLMLCMAFGSPACLPTARQLQLERQKCYGSPLLFPLSLSLSLSVSLYLFACAFACAFPQHPPESLCGKRCDAIFVFCGLKINISCFSYFVTSKSRLPMLLPQSPGRDKGGTRAGQGRDFRTCSKRQHIFHMQATVAALGGATSAFARRTNLSKAMGSPPTSPLSLKRVGPE